jgi:hypothetical protein
MASKLRWSWMQVISASFHLTSTRAGPPSGLLRSEPSTARFKGKSQATVARRLDMARPRPAHGLRPRLSATRPCSPWRSTPLEAFRLRRF